MKTYKRTLFLGTILTALGITLTTILDDSRRPIGIVLIAIGGLFFILGMKSKREEDGLKKEG